ncbi:MAG: hypothetical protein IIA85_03260 [Nanoarchaeota archaeon]|nr:hypothetical protein [Nanoarchaeota archaeon]
MFSSTFLAPFGFYGGDIGNFLLQLEQLGFFSYLLPFLVIFALIFGILSRINIFEDNKAINAIISLSVGLMALQFGFVSNFFSEIFPRLGVGLAIILVVLIFLGLFMDPEQKAMNYGMLGIGAIIVVVILIESAVFSGTSFGFFIRQYAGLGLILLVVGGLVAAAIASAGKRDRTYRRGESPLERALRGGGK